MLRSRILRFVLVGSSIAASAFGQGPSPSIRFLDFDSGQPLTRVQELSRFTIEVTDGASAGLGTLPLQVSSDLRGQQLPLYADEVPQGSGVFVASLVVEPRHPSDPDAPGGINVTEDAGPPQRYDTVRVTLGCPSAPCPEAAVPVYASELRFLDLAGEPLSVLPIGSSFLVDIADNGLYYPAQWVTAQPGGDVEAIYPHYAGGFPYAIHSRLTVPTAAGPAVPYDGVLQVEDGGTVTVTHPNLLGFTTTTLTAPVGSTLELLDRWGDPVELVLAQGPVRVRYTNPAANLDPGGPDAFTVQLRTVEIGGATRDSEDLQLQETGPSTGVFTGQILSRMSYFQTAYDGVLDAWVAFSGENDQVEVTAGVRQAMVPILGSIVRVVDAAGTDLDQVAQGDLVHIRVESDEYNGSPTLQEPLYAWVRSETTGDQEYPVVLTETGLDTSLFEGSLQTVEGTSPILGNGALEVQVGETLSVEHWGYYGSSVDTAAVVEGSPPPNLPPVAVDETVETLRDVPVEIPVLANDSDPDGDPLAIVLFTQPTGGGTVTQSGSSALTYTPPPGASPVDSFLYRVADSHGAEAVGIVTVRVLRPAAAVDDAYTVAEDGSVEFSVTENDSNPDDQSLEIAAFGQPEHGQALLLDPAAGLFRYTPNPNYNGPDSFLYDLPGGSFGVVSITVAPVNDPPSAGADSAATPEDTALSIAVLGNDLDLDGNPLAVTGVTQPAHGSVSYAASSVTYTPAPNYNGGDAFTYTISDGNGGSASAPVAVTVTPVNDPPVGMADGGSTREGVAVTLAVLANDSDLEGGALSVVAVSTPAGGTATFTASSVTYTPAANFDGTDSFTYTVSDGAATASAQVIVTVAEALERVAVLATHSLSLQSGADVLSGDVVANTVGTAPFLNGVELSVGGSVTTPAGWEVEGNRITIAAGALVPGALFYNTLTNSGTAAGPRTTPVTLPVFASLPPFLAATPGTSDVSVSANGSRTLAPGSYRDLVVGKRGTVTFTGGTYHFRSISADTQVKLLFSAASTVRVQQKMAVKGTGTIGPSSGASIDGSALVFYVGGVNGTGGGLSATPKALEIGVDGVVRANLYVPNGTLSIADRTLATGSFLGLDVLIGPNAQVTLQSAWSGR